MLSCFGLTRLAFINEKEAFLETLEIIKSSGLLYNLKRP